MTELQEVLDSKSTSHIIVQGMQEKKALNIVTMDLRDVENSVADYFVICSGSSDTQLDAIADSVEEEMYKHGGMNPWRKEGSDNKEWILLDYVDVVVHIFKKDRREFYALEKLWGDATITEVDN